MVSGLDYPPFLLSKIHGTNSPGRVCFTFDDGPNEKYTMELLDVLGRYGVKAIFFCIGANIVKNPKIVEEIFRMGHLVQNHSNSHADFSRLSSEESEMEIVTCRKVIEEITGAKFIRLFRPPHGLISVRNLMVARKCKENVMLWSMKYEENLTERNNKIHGRIFLGHDDDPLVTYFVDRTCRILKEWNIAAVDPKEIFIEESFLKRF
jgi:peptidoglycan/xylan/chitin deacetylase (PgdA/CDA1 family)